MFNCISPFYLKSQGYYVGCGHCLLCRLRNTRDWTIRLMHERQLYTYATFVTLTYDDDHLPSSKLRGRGSLRKTDFQKFIKRLRVNLERKYYHLYDQEIKYYACGEYGSSLYTERPHYHAIIFGLDSYIHHDIIAEVWDKCDHDVGVVCEPFETKAVASYVAGYIQKKLTGQKAFEAYDQYELERPFLLVSKGIGKEWCRGNAIQYKKQKFCRLKGHKCPLPRYYRQILGLTAEDYVDEVAKSQDTWIIKARENHIPIYEVDTTKLDSNTVTIPINEDSDTVQINLNSNTVQINLISDSSKKQYLYRRFHKSISKYHFEQGLHIAGIPITMAFFAYCLTSCRQKAINILSSYQNRRHKL